MHMFSRNWKKPYVTIQFPDKKEMSFNIITRMLTGHKRFLILKQAVSRLWDFVKESVLEKNGESAARKARVGDIIVSCKLILSFLFLGFRLGLSQGTLHKLIGQWTIMILGHLPGQWECGWERLGCNTVVVVVVVVVALLCFLNNIYSLIFRVWIVLNSSIVGSSKHLSCYSDILMVLLALAKFCPLLISDICIPP